jgi:hypothetical protein
MYVKADSYETVMHDQLAMLVFYKDDEEDTVVATFVGTNFVVIEEEEQT